MVFAPGASSNATGYDDALAVQSYLECFWSWHMTEFEKRCYRDGARLAKAQLESESPWGQRVIAEWDQTTDTHARKALADGFTRFEQRVRQRIMEEFRVGTLCVKRCPRCHRVVRTPEARQCLLCGHDWH